MQYEPVEFHILDSQISALFKNFTSGSWLH